MRKNRRFKLCYSFSPYTRSGFHYKTQEAATGNCDAVGYLSEAGGGRHGVAAASSHDTPDALQKRLNCVSQVMQGGDGPRCSNRRRTTTKESDVSEGEVKVWRIKQARRTFYCHIFGFVSAGTEPTETLISATPSRDTLEADDAGCDSDAADLNWLLKRLNDATPLYWRPQNNLSRIVKLLNILYFLRTWPVFLSLGWIIQVSTICLDCVLYPSQKPKHTLTQVFVQPNRDPRKIFRCKMNVLAFERQAIHHAGRLLPPTLSERRAAYVTNVLCDTSTWMSGETWAWQPRRRVRGGWEDGAEGKNNCGAWRAQNSRAVREKPDEVISLDPTAVGSL